MIRRSNLALLPLALTVHVACAGARSQAAIDQDTETFYAAFEAEVESQVRALDEGGIEQLRDILPLAEVEGATEDVLDVIQTRPALRPMVRGIRRFLSEEPSNWVRREIATEQGDRRLWHVLLDAIQAELRAVAPLGVPWSPGPEEGGFRPIGCNPSYTLPGSSVHR